MNEKLVIVARIEANPGHEDQVRNALTNLIAPTLSEAGCIQYDLHQDNSNPGTFLFYEVWESRELWQDHLKSPHVLANGPATEGAIASVTMNEMTKLL
jgi:quinol monooxygenase YgiN